MGVTGRTDTCAASGRSWLDPSGRIRSYRRAAVVLLALLLVAPGVARAAYVCFFPESPFASPPYNVTNYAVSKCNTELTWPSSWTPIGKVAESAADYTPSYNDLIGKTNFPGIWAAIKDGFIYFRARVNYGSAVNATTGSPYTLGSGTLFILLTRNTPVAGNASVPSFAIAWDNALDMAAHGLEMNYQAKPTAQKWAEIDFSDVDGTNASKCAADIDGSGNAPGGPCPFTPSRKEGYVRTYDGISYDGSTSLFVEIAVACSYFTRAAAVPTYGARMSGFNPCTQTFYASAAMGSQNDNNPWTGNSVDLYGIDAWDGSTLVGTGIWGGSFDPTSVVVTDFQSHRTDREVEVSWTTASEVGTAGFHLYRVEPGTGSRIQVNRHLVASLEGSPNGGRYVVRDPGAPPGAESTYVLEEIEHGGTNRTYGPFTVRPEAAEPEHAASRVGSSGWSRAHRSDDVGAANVVYSPHDDSQPRTYAHATKKSRPRHSSSHAGSASGAARVVVSTEGLQVLDSATIASSLGMTEAATRTAIRSRKLSIVGPEGPVACQPSEDGRRLYFHGKPLKSTWSDTAVYWLTRGECREFGRVEGSRLRGTPPATTVFMDQAHTEQDAFPLTALFQQPWEDFWFWTQLIGNHPTLGAASYLLPLPGATGGAGAVTVNVHGQTSSGKGGDHHVRLTLNGSLLGDTTWEGTTPASASFTVPAGVIAPGGSNELRLEALLDVGLPYSVIVLDSFDVSWERSARAVADQLRMPQGLSGDVVIDGFNGGDIWVLDLGEPGRPRRLEIAQTGARDGSSFVRFFAPSAGGPFLAVRPAAAAVPVVEVVPERASLKKLGVRGADYLVLTSEKLAAGAKMLAELRSAQALRTLVVTVEQIYDEYNVGNLDPAALHAFLSDVHRTWRRVPRFLVLAGSGTYDGRGVLGVDDNHVPPLLVMGAKALGPSDVALADVEGDDGVPEFAVGRIPASTDAELVAYVEKLKAYESDSGAWMNRALFLTDNPDQGGDFPADSLLSIDLLAGRMTVQQVNHVADKVATRAELLQALSDGVGLFHYFGHAATDRLANEGLLTSADVDAMTNGGRAPIALLMTCSAGLYGYPGYDSLAIRLTKKGGGGAIAVVAPSSLEWESDSRVLSQGMLSALSSGTRSVGEAFVLGLVASRDAQTPIAMRRTYTLFGDPAVGPRP